MNKYNSTRLFAVSSALLLTATSAVSIANPTATSPNRTQSVLTVADVNFPWVSGKIVRISKKRGVVTIAHEAISNLSMPSMTMGFKTKDAATLESLTKGDVIEFQADQVDGDLLIVNIREQSS